MMSLLEAAWVIARRDSSPRYSRSFICSDRRDHLGAGRW